MTTFSLKFIISLKIASGSDLEVKRLKQEEVNEEVGKYIESKMKERELHLSEIGKIKGRKLSRNFLAKEVLKVSLTWFSGVINGVNTANDEILMKIASFLETDEDEIFKVARRIHPEKLESYRKDYLGDYYVKID